MLMRLDEEEEAMRAGTLGRPRQWAIEQQIRVGEFFDAVNFVRVAQVHLMADTESLGESGVRFLEDLATARPEERRVRVPTVTDPRGIDFQAYRRIGQTSWMADLEARAVGAFRNMGILMTDTCINYQTILPPVLGEHLAFGDTGSTIYANSVLGARSNFEGGPAALAAALTGRAPRYGYHLPEKRRGTALFELSFRPRDLAEWGAVGGIVGRAVQSYWQVPVILGVETVPTSDELKHFGAALASFGTVALFHMPGVTPEARAIGDAFDGAPPAAMRIARADLEAFLRGYDAPGEKLDVVVFAAPQLSLVELQDLSRLLAGKRINAETALLVTTAPAIKALADTMGITATIEEAGGVVLSGVCFYQMHAREIGEAMGWKRLMSNSAKLVNIIGGYGYRPTLATMERCVESAIAGRVS